MYNINNYNHLDMNLRIYKKYYALYLIINNITENYIDIVDKFIARF